MLQSPQGSGTIHPYIYLMINNSVIMTKLKYQSGMNTCDQLALCSLKKNILLLKKHIILVSFTRVNLKDCGRNVAHQIESLLYIFYFTKSECLFLHICQFKCQFR